MRIVIPRQSPREVNTFDSPEPVPKESYGHRKSSKKFVSDWCVNNVKTSNHKTVTRSLQGPPNFYGFPEAFKC